jgi:NagD protein
MAVVPAFERSPSGFVLDLDGTVYLGDVLLPGAAEAIAHLRSRDRRVAFLTNKPLERGSDYARKLTKLGIPTDAADIVTSVDALLHYLAGHPPSGPILTVAEPLLTTVLGEAGHAVTTDPELATMVVVSWDRTFSYETLERAFRAVRHGARIVATNPDPSCPGPDGPVPDCAAMLAALEACTERRAEAIVGKPSRHMAEAVLSRLGLPAAEVAMVGDRLLTDIAMARETGMLGVLVLSGVTSRDDLAAEGAVQPDLVIDGLSELIERVP